MRQRDRKIVRQIDRRQASHYSDSQAHNEIHVKNLILRQKKTEKD